MDCAKRNNPIHPFEFTYLITLLLFILYGVTFKCLKVDFYPIPKEVRTVYILRCVIGMMCNLSFLLSLQYIPFSKASVLFWTSPVFTAIMSKYFLNEILSIFDWVAVVVAFFGILII